MMKMMKSTYRILVVDDEPDLREILQVNLENAGYMVDTASSAEEALALNLEVYDLLLLDVMLGGISGFALAKRIRERLKSDVPIVFLTAKDTENDLLTGFSLGADDYIAKPFSLQEVLARVKACLRRTAPRGDDEPEELREGEVAIDFAKKSVRAGDTEVRLSRKEFGILALLMGSPGRVFSREEIMRQVWDNDACVLERTVDVHIARLRRKLGASGAHIVNRQGYGYCFL